MTDFSDNYSSLLQTAFETGANSIPLHRLLDHSFSDLKQQKRFISACHRGYDKAQNYVVQLLNETVENIELSTEEKQFRELLLRKVMDGIALTMLQGKTHVMRRLCLHDKAPSLSKTVVQEALNVANKMNRESRQTFTLLADLTTFIHVTDLIRVDFRSFPASVSLIELKSGKVNNLLLAQLENYEPKIESLKALENDPLIDKAYLPQATRMLRQKIRLAQIDEILTTDQGTDIKLNASIKLSEQEVGELSYDSFLEQLCGEAKNKGYAAGTVNYCIHIGVGFSENEDEAKRRGIEALNYAINQHLADPPDGLTDVLNEVSILVPKKELFSGVNVFLSNLTAIPCRSFVLWNLDRNHLRSLIVKKLCILASFDISSFIYLGRKLGLESSLSSRKKAMEEAQKFGSLNVPRWGGRGLVFKTSKGEIFVFSGMLSRFINDLVAPAPFLSQAFDT